MIEENGDVFGDGVNIAARLEAMAEPGGIYVSAAVVRSADKNRGERFERIGRQRAKNIPEPIEVYAVRLRTRASAAGRMRLRGAAPAMGGDGGGRGVLAAVGLRPWRLTLDVTGSTSIAEHLPGAMRTGERRQADTRPAVAVLPFDNMSGDPAQAYFTDGLTEDIITELARNRELSVIARNSTFAFRDKPTDIREIGATLGAATSSRGARAGPAISCASWRS